MTRRASSFFADVALLGDAVVAGVSAVLVSVGFSTGLFASEVVTSAFFEFFALLIGVGFMRY
jgi:hypothetical protein